MAQTIKLKRSNQSDSTGVPTTSQLELGEVAINTHHGKMYIKKSDEADPNPTEEIVEVGKIAKGLDAPTDEVITIGDNNELSISVADVGGTINSTISETGNGSLLIKGDHLGLTSPSNELYLLASENESVSLYFNGEQKLVTTGTGISVDDKIVADELEASESINVASGKLFVSNSGSANSKYYTKMGDYGEGNFFAKGGGNNGAVYTLGVGSEGKIVEDQKIKTFEIKGEGFLNINANPLTLIPAESGKAHIIHDIVFFIEHTGHGAYNANATPTGGNGVYYSGTTGNGWIQNNFLYEIGFYNTSSSFKQLVYMPRTHLAQSAADSIFLNQGIKDHKLYANRALVLQSPANNVITNSAYVPVDGNRHFIKVRYSTVSMDADFRNLTEGDSGRTVFDGS